MSSKRRKFTTAAAGLVSSALLWSFGFAARAASLIEDTGLGSTARESGVPTKTNLAGMIGRVIGGLATIMGSLFLALIIYGGFLYMTAQGNDEKIKKAKSVITGSIIGIIIIFSAYALVGFVINNIVTPAVTDAPASAGGDAKPCDLPGGCEAPF